MKIHIVSHSKHPLPAYETAASAGMDFGANLSSEISLKPLERGAGKVGHTWVKWNYDLRITNYE
jgi:dUTP pyrophosphatase